MPPGESRLPEDLGDPTVTKTRTTTARLLCAGLLGLSAAALLAADAGKPPVDAGKAYATDLSAMPVGKPPEELFILNGAFQVAEADGNKFLELPGSPLDSFGVLFGPEEMQAAEASARILATSAGRLFPEFGVGTNDAGGWKLWVMPGQDALVLRKKWDREVEEVTRVPFKWSSGQWTHLRLRVAPAADGKWQVQGKAWQAGGKEPAEWTISTTDDAAPPKGRAGVWGHPYAGTPIRFDDLAAGPAK
jgi:hypothetical protein